MRYILTFLMLGITQHILYAQTTDFATGARSKGIGDASAAYSDVWAVFNNIGSLYGERDFTMAITYFTLHQVEGFNGGAVCINLPHEKFNFGTGAFYFGDEIYKESRFTAGLSHKINFVSLGVSVNYLQYNILEFGSSTSWVIEMGGLVEFTSKLHFGASIYNLNQAQLSESQQQVPVLMKAGLSFKPIDKLMMNLDLEKNQTLKANIKSGMEYQVIKQLMVRMGINTSPSTSHFGIGFLTHRGNIDYAISNHFPLGLSHHVSANIKLNRKK